MTSAIKNDDRTEVLRHWAAMPGCVEAMQVAVYVMIGGGMLGNFAATQPAQFYIDTRCGRLRYPKRTIYRAVRDLVLIAKAAGLDPNKLPQMPRFPNMGGAF
jgi:hypothetical protein